MRDLKSRLRDADPLAREGDMAPADVQRMRHAILSTSRESQPRRSRVSIAIAATLLVGTAGAALATRALVNGTAPMMQETVSAPIAQPATRQLLFVAPGGTRLIWTFNPNFSVR